MRFAVRLKQLKEVLDTYKYPLPFSQHLQDYFKRNKQLGSKDRKQLRQVAYKYFRLHNLLPEYSTNDKLVIAALISKELTAEDAATLVEKEELQILLKEPSKLLENVSKVFPASKAISEYFKNAGFYESLLRQPYVWIAVKKGKEKDVAGEFQRNNIAYEEETSGIWRLNPEIKLDNLQAYQKGYFRIQDLSSQRTSELFKAKSGETWWDACSGAGGKSLALLDSCENIRLYNSDTRQSILQQLTQRLDLYGYSSARIFQADLTKAAPTDLPQFDGIILDVPCTGSGTWARNPENLVYFDKAAINDFREKQLTILKNVYPFLKKDKPLIYITCSIFKAENEEVIEAFSKENNVEIEAQKYLEGYKSGAENMFICRLKKLAD